MSLYSVRYTRGLHKQCTVEVFTSNDVNIKSRVARRKYEVFKTNDVRTNSSQATTWMRSLFDQMYVRILHNQRRGCEVLTFRCTYEFFTSNDVNAKSLRSDVRTNYSQATTWMRSLQNQWCSDTRSLCKEWQIHQAITNSPRRVLILILHMGIIYYHLIWIALRILTHQGKCLSNQSHTLNVSW